MHFENVNISIKISLKFLANGLINNIPALAQVMAWRRSGDKPLSEPMPTQFTDEYMLLWGSVISLCFRTWLDTWPKHGCKCSHNKWTSVFHYLSVMRPYVCIVNNSCIGLLTMTAACDTNGKGCIKLINRKYTKFSYYTPRYCYD